MCRGYRDCRMTAKPHMTTTQGSQPGRRLLDCREAADALTGSTPTIEKDKLSSELSLAVDRGGGCECHRKTAPCLMRWRNLRNGEADFCAILIHPGDAQEI